MHTPLPVPPLEIQAIRATGGRSVLGFPALKDNCATAAENFFSKKEFESNKLRSTSSRRPCSAVIPAIGTEAACSNVMPAGLSVIARSARGHVFGKGTISPTKYLITDFELRHAFADCFNRSSKIDAESCLLWFAQAAAHCA